MAYPLKKNVPLEGAPYWYGTHISKLDFEWSKEEELELERYCEKILKNCEEEEMTPRDRFLAQFYSKPDDYKNADRKHMYCGTMVTFPTRTLDCHAGALVPIDLYRSPKLLVKGQMATMARFKEDYVSWANIIYTEDLWGGKARMIDYGNPSQVGDPPVKDMKDFEALAKKPLPDPRKVGLYPGYLWAARENRRLIDTYKLPIPLHTSCCPGATEVATLGMLGWTPFQMALRRNPELARKCSDLGQEWCKAFGDAMIEEAHPEAIYWCQFTGGFHMKGNEWVADQWRELGEHLKATSQRVSKFKVPGKPDGNLHLSHGYSYLSGVFEWYEICYEHKHMCEEMFDGGWGGYSSDVDMNRIYEWHRDHNMCIGLSINNTTLEKGTTAEVEEEIKVGAEYSMQGRKVSLSTVPIYFVPPANLDAACSAYKKYNQLKFANEPAYNKRTGVYPIKPRKA